MLFSRRTILAAGAAGAILPGFAWAAPPAGSRSGLDLSAMDPTVRPGDDFYLHANGGWLARTEIPSDKSQISAYEEAAERVRAQVREIVEQSARAPANATSRLIGNLYASLMDEARIEQLGRRPTDPDLRRIMAIRSPAEMAEAMARLGRFYPIDPFGAEAASYPSPITSTTFWDVKEPSLYRATLVQGGLGLPDREHYTGDGPNFAKARQAYLAYLAALLGFAGRKVPAERAARVLALETRIAAGQRPRAELFAFDKRHNLWTPAELEAAIPGYPWRPFLKAAGFDRQERIVAADPDAFRAVAAALRDLPLDVWRDYLLARTLDAFAPYGPRLLANARFDFHERALRGVPEPRPRLKRVLAQMDLAIGPAIGTEYLRRHLAPDARSELARMVDSIKAAMGERIDALAWMSPATRREARAKLAKLRIEIGGEEKPRDYGSLRFHRDRAWANIQAAAALEYQRKLRRLDGPVDRGEWDLLPHQINAMANPILVKLVFSAGLLQWLYKPGADPAVNYGSLGYFIAHEVTHIFDNVGSGFDAGGKLRNWWQPADRARFDQATASLAAQYDAYELLPGLFAKGRQTLTENVADLGGVTLALQAYRSLSGTGAGSQIDGFSGDQRFFLSYAQMWRAKHRDEAIRQKTAVGTHSLERYRVMTVRNLDPWYSSFKVAPGDRMYLPPDQRVRIW